MNRRAGLTLAAAAIAGGGVAYGVFILMSRGRFALDVGWGRSYFPLGPIEVSMAAPRELVFDIIQGAYSERAPAEVKRHIKVTERGGDQVVAEHRTPLKFLDAITVETVRFERPSRVSFALLRGPCRTCTRPSSWSSTTASRPSRTRERWERISGCSDVGMAVAS